ncbi:MAG TPA: WxcM-like domain-containing protein [Candidatus Syntrophosphaera sp.]|nr:WxcM-like domain-containing protein [Candidatus Cloacimonadota bacterium]HOR02715.1 WxcM-like domain-containing protein [Candidatus Syntrophosphaera sp.]
MNEDYKVKKNRKINTRNRFRQGNGYLVPILDIQEGFLPGKDFPRQIYLTVVAPAEVKGPHFHKQRYAMYTCIQGNIKVVLKTDAGYMAFYSGEDYDYATIWVRAGIPTAVINLEREKPSLIINMPNPSFLETPDDDMDVEFDPEMLLMDTKQEQNR